MATIFSLADLRQSKKCRTRFFGTNAVSSDPVLALFLSQSGKMREWGQNAAAEPLLPEPNANDQ